MYNTRLVAKNPSKVTGRAKIYVEVEIKSTTQKKRFYYPTHESILYKHWRNGKISKSENNWQEIKKRIDLLHEEVKETLFQLAKDNSIISIALLKDTLAGKNAPAKGLVTHLNEFIAVKRLTAKPSLVKKLITIRNHIRDFSGGKDLNLKQISQSFINELTHYWQHQINLQPNTINKNFKFLKQLLNYLHVEGILDSDKFKKLSYPSEVPTDTIALTKEEVLKLTAYVPKTAKLSKVKDLFLILIYSGLRFSDGVRINKSWLKEGFLLIRTQKTDDKLSIPLHLILRELLERYDYNLQALAISNQKFNEYVKELCEAAEINEPIEIVKYVKNIKTYIIKPKYQLISSHTGRRTFITNSIIAGVPLSVIQKITGHKKLTTLQKYVNISEEIGARKMELFSNYFKD